MAVYIAPGNGTEITSAPGAAPIESLGIAYVSQRPQANWCWAACTVMVASHLGVMDQDLAGPPTMCHLASIAHNIPNCCVDPSACDMGAWPEIAYSHLSISVNPDIPSPPVNSERVLTLDEIRQQILTSRRPVEVMYKWSTHGAHVVLITGVYGDGTLEVFDPWFGIESPVSYDYVRGGRGMGRWAGTYSDFQIAPAAGA
ncbi:MULTISPECIES: papain-like cysteine protease family protein [unclassified Bradyrhizobium]|uniref:papain-like cysteine protease family protein n=1 Tax=unclassified Bradyrhizobium TaxID=2631580 RepID=UPI00211E2609|nr:MULTISPECIES: papain-like cysteine protease family protein [unclassified Bradyrhizobium]MDD1535900.1 hypothetical protein [Bradyrhizobium sp. WBOS8]MDD1585425.1 hypothetical protein [Bradyrhizobium sp. WBOS4]UUO48680.1 hypothetical protein DCM78_18275 [Bradyrhizobium sp. WBOS04]UUO62500.1 hypothetical protein DCM80_27145 [Bradyrhizobium sp. WBOS08]